MYNFKQFETFYTYLVMVPDWEAFWKLTMYMCIYKYIFMCAYIDVYEVFQPDEWPTSCSMYF